jgi:hypothetical protein
MPPKSFARTETRLLRIAGIEGFDRLGLDIDAMQSRVARRLRRGWNQRERQDRQKGRDAGDDGFQG